MTRHVKDLTEGRCKTLNSLGHGKNCETGCKLTSIERSVTLQKKKKKDNTKLDLSCSQGARSGSRQTSEESNDQTVYNMWFLECIMKNERAIFY